MPSSRIPTPWILTLTGVSLLSWNAPAQAQLSDISTYWGSPYITSLANQQVLGGFPDGTFRPNEQVTRAQFAVIITKAFGLDTNVPPTRFSDAIPTWAAPAINAASGAGFVSGFPDGTFRPNDVLTRAQAITVLTKAAAAPAVDPAQVEPILSYYTDTLGIPNFARPPVASATQAGIVVLYPDPQRLNAASVATRGEVAALTYLALTRAGKVPALAVPPGATIPVVGTLPKPTDIPVEPLPQAPQIKDFLTRTNLSVPQRPGNTLSVVLQGTSGGQATFSIGTLIKNIPLTETRPGQYEGSYTFRTGDQANKAPVQARLQKGGLQEVARLEQTVTIGVVSDQSFPNIEAVSPPEQSRVSERTPTISARLSDNKGLDLNSFILLVNNVDVSAQAQLTRGGFSYTPNRPLPNNRAITVQVQISDTSGNTAFKRWSFQVEAKPPVAPGEAKPAPTDKPKPGVSGKPKPGAKDKATPQVISSPAASGVPGDSTAGDPTPEPGTPTGSPSPTPSSGLRPFTPPNKP